MAKFKKDSLIPTGACWSDWFSSFSSPLIDVSGDVITIDSAFVISFDSGVLTISQNGTSIATMNCNSAITVTAVISNTFVYIQGYDSAVHRFIFVYEIIGTQKLYTVYGSGATGSVAYMPISSLTFVDTDSGIEYVHAARLNFSANLGNIAFAKDALFQNSVRDIEDPNLITCSALDADQIHAFDLNNFYALGPNTLIRLDLET